MTIVSIDLPEPLATIYFDKSRESGRKISDLVVRDLKVLFRRRKRREDGRVFKENEYERL